MWSQTFTYSVCLDVVVRDNLTCFTTSLHAFLAGNLIKHGENFACHICELDSKFEMNVAGDGIEVLTSLYMSCCGDVCPVQILMLRGHNCVLFIPQIRRGGVHYRGQVRLVTSSHPFQTSWCRRKQCVLAQNGVQTAICLLTSLTTEADPRCDLIHDST